MKMILLGVVIAFFVNSTDDRAIQKTSLLEDPRAWETIASEGVQVRSSTERSAAGAPALRIDFDFTKGAGYGGVALARAIDLPENFELALTVRGQGPANNLELKLVDDTGLNVWWVNRRAFEWPAQSTPLSNRRRHFQFAWGPAGGEKPLTRIGRIELIIAANEGGRGTVWVEDLRFTPLEPERPYTGTPSASGTSGNARGVLADGGETWVAADDDAHPRLNVDFGQPRDIGGIVVHRPKGPLGVHFDVEASENGATWRTVRRVRFAGPLASWIALPDLQARWLRLSFDRTGGAPVPAVTKIEFLDPASGASPNALWRTRAARAPRGLYPRNLLDEQSFWTVVGVPGDARAALINEEGQVEVDKRAFSVEPFIVRADGTLLTWNDAAHEQSLREG
jgi:hypothetical protein